MNSIKKWSEFALIRKYQIESGLDTTFLKYFVPFYKKETKGYDSVVDVGCGTGHLLKSIKCRVKVGIEPAQGMFQVAQEVLKGQAGVKIFNKKIQDIKLSGGSEICICHMVLNSVDRPSFSGFLKSLRGLKYKKYLITIPHPCFWLPGSGWDTPKIYLDSVEFIGKLNVGNDAKSFDVPFVHRSLSEYFNSIINSRFNIIKIQEHDIPKNGHKSNWNSSRYITFFCEINNASNESLHRTEN